jgi:8-oxo-dGTP diphosphatase
MGPNSSLPLKKLRFQVPVACYLIIRKNDEVLLHLRQNSGYCDGQYDLIAGHVEENESVLQSMVREAYEEAGIQITAEDLNLVHTSHRKTDRTYMNLFFECRSFTGELTNCEPEKCGGLHYYPLDRLPPNTIDYVATVLRAIASGKSYSEAGW